MNPLVSIIIPCYNQGEYLDDAINSIFEQTYDNYEVIIVNDGSTDSYTIKKLNTLSSSILKTFHTKNQGLPSARNYGIKQSKGIYILPLDADDKIHCTFIEKAVQILETNLHIAIVGSYYQHFGISNWIGNYGISGKSEVYVKADPNTLCTALYRKEWELTGGYDETYTNGFEDWEFWINLLKITKKEVYVIPEILFYYRKKMNSMAVLVDKEKPDFVKKLIEKHYEIYKDNFVEAIIDRERKLIEDSKRIKSFQKINEELASKLLMSYFHIVSTKSPILIYGMGRVAEIVLNLMSEKGLKVQAIIDQKAKEVSCSFHGIPIISISEAIKNTSSGIIVITSIMNYQFLENLIVEELKSYPSIITTVSIDGIKIC